MYFKTREIEEEDKEDDYSDSHSSSDDEGDADQDDSGDNGVELMEIYETECDKVQAFYSETCKCKMGLGEMACSATLNLDDVTECRNNCNELSSAELDLVILGIIHSSLNCNETSISGRVEKNRQSTKMCFFYHGKRICKKTFLVLHCLQYYRFHSLVKHYRKNGLTLWTHGNSKRLPSRAASTETVERVVKFIKNVSVCKMGLTGQTRLLLLVAFVHLPFSLRSLDLFVAYEGRFVLCCKEKIEPLDRVMANFKRS